MTDPILLATDGSEIAGYACLEACRLARALEAPLEIVNVADPDAYEARFARLSREVDVDLDTLTEIGEQALAEAASRARKQGLDVETRVLQGSPAETLVEHAGEQEVACLVLGTHHQGDLHHNVLGSVADRVIRTATVPAMTVREAPRFDVDDPYRRLLVPTDGSAETERAADHALEWASAMGAEIEFVHVIPPEIEEGPYWAEDTALGEEEIAELENEALDPLVRGAEDAGVSYETVTARGDVHDEILDAAVDSNVDAIVLSTTGWGGAQRFWLGSVADKLVRESTFPVVTVRGEGPSV